MKNFKVAVATILLIQGLVSLASPVQARGSGGKASQMEIPAPKPIGHPPVPPSPKPGCRCTVV
jgi:hypothetical protein